MTAYERVKSHMQLTYRKSMDELEISNTPGYWRDKHPCNGQNGCRHPLHSYIGNSEGTKHTYYFAEFGRDKKGRFMRPFRAWEELLK